MPTDSRATSGNLSANQDQETLRLGISTGALWPDHTTLEAPDVIARLGLHDVEIMLQNEGEYAPTFTTQLRQKIEQAGLSVRSVHVRQGLHPLFVPDTARVEQGRDLFHRGIAAAAELGADLVVWHGIERTYLDEPDIEKRFLSTTNELAEVAHAAGVTLAIENVSWCILASVRDVLMLASQLTEIRPEIRPGFVFDPFQAAEAGANPFMMLAAMEDRLLNVHLSDYDEAEGASRHLLPGDGSLPWPALMRAIAAEYQGPMMLESPLGPNPAPSFRRVRDVLDPLILSATQAADPHGTPPPGVLEGIALFNAGEYYEAHESLEHEWHAERGPVRRLYQGILQVGVGFHHARHGNHRGAILLLTDGITKVSEFAPRWLGIETGRLVTESQVCLDQIKALGQDGIAAFDVSSAPRIHMTPSRKADSPAS